MLSARLVGSSAGSQATSALVGVPATAMTKRGALTLASSGWALRVSMRPAMDGASVSAAPRRTAPAIRASS